ncbi:hypothetical protein vBVpPvVp04M_00005 [Vibrio phage vB_Vp_PvVp04_M]|nr:hypothetical protein vBVpPvVp04M_00005 [Vibrio phage vB_Vp_PvVp04_M]
MEIKIKAWNSVDRVMVPFATLCAQPKLLADIIRGKLKYYIPLMHTGMKDKNGVEIYENDIALEMYSDGVSTKTHVVKFDVQRGGYIPFIYISSRDSQFKIIGNIHQNPELMK